MLAAWEWAPSVRGRRWGVEGPLPPTVQSRRALCWHSVDTWPLPLDLSSTAGIACGKGASGSLPGCTVGTLPGCKRHHTADSSGANAASSCGPHTRQSRESSPRAARVSHLPARECNRPPVHAQNQDPGNKCGTQTNGSTLGPKA